MTGVGRQADVNFVTVARLTLGLISEVVFNITVAVDRIRHIILRKFTKNVVEGFTEEVSQNIEAPAMRHAHNDLVYAVFTAAFQYAFEAGDQCFAALERETLLTDIAGLEKVFEILRLHDRL